MSVSAFHDYPRHKLAVFSLSLKLVYFFRFVCIYTYNGQKADELPLIRGEIYCVLERYRDGWCKGYRARSRSKKTGMFPGTYLKPAR